MDGGGVVQALGILSYVFLMGRIERLPGVPSPEAAAQPSAGG